jgi:hypothetical protein
MKSVGSWELPAGYLDASGVLHRQVQLHALSGHEEELLSSTEYPGPETVTEVLRNCVDRIGSITEIDSDILRQLCVADRQYLLLMLRQLTFGDRVQATLPCPWPGCGENVDLDFNISDIPLTLCSYQANYHLELEPDLCVDILALADTAPVTVVYRLPNGGDQEAVLKANRNNGSRALSQLFSRCIVRIGSVENPTEEFIRSLPAQLRKRIEEDMESHAPNLDLTMEAHCPGCQRNFTAPFELQDFFFGEIKFGTQLLFREVHYLAFHYHWSENEILAMPRSRRRQYIEILSDEIEKINESFSKQ